MSSVSSFFSYINDARSHEPEDPLASLTLHIPSRPDSNRSLDIPHAPYTKVAHSCRLQYSVSVTACSCHVYQVSIWKQVIKNENFIRYCTSQYVWITVDSNAVCRPRLAFGTLQQYTYYVFRKANVLSLILQITSATQQYVLSAIKAAVTLCTWMVLWKLSHNERSTLLPCDLFLLYWWSRGFHSLRSHGFIIAFIVQCDELCSVSCAVLSHSGGSREINRNKQFNTHC